MMMIFNKLVLTLTLIVLSVNYVQAQCLTGDCGVVYSDPIIYSAPPVVYSNRSVYSAPPLVYLEPLHLHLKNIPGGVERTRHYVNVYVESDKYTSEIPVINGVLPDVTLHKIGSRKVNHIVLDYGSNRAYDKKYVRSNGYIYYKDQVNQKNTPSAVKLELEAPINARKNEVPSAVKSENTPNKVISPEAIIPIPKSSLIRPSDSEIDDILNRKSDEAVNTSNSDKSLDDEIDSLLKRPSSVMDGNTTFPNYNR